MILNYAKELAGNLDTIVTSSQKDILSVSSAISPDLVVLLYSDEVAINFYRGYFANRNIDCFILRFNDIDTPTHGLVHFTPGLINNLLQSLRVRGYIGGRKRARRVIFSCFAGISRSIAFQLSFACLASSYSPAEIFGRMRDYSPSADSNILVLKIFAGACNRDDLIFDIGSPVGEHSWGIPCLLRRGVDF